MFIYSSQQSWQNDHLTFIILRFLIIQLLQAFSSQIKKIKYVLDCIYWERHKQRIKGHLNIFCRRIVLFLHGCNNCNKSLLILQVQIE